MSKRRRRLMMMQMQQSKKDYLEGYRLNVSAVNQSYRLGVNWSTNDTLRFYHTTSGFMGPSTAAILFMGQKVGYSSGIGYTLLGKEYPISTLEYGKNYRLALTVLEIIKNTATTDNDGNFKIALGSYHGHTATTIKLSELEVGKTIEVIRINYNSTNPITSAGFEVTNSALLWDITFKVEFEEV